MFDWFKKYADLEATFNALIPSKSSQILMLGCGNSTLSEDMFDAGYTHILNVDFSQTVIQKMRARRPEMKWEVMNVQQMDGVLSESVDVAIDKGTMDALMCEKGDVWDPPQSVVEDVKKEVDEVERVLKKGGKFIYITFGQPHFRKRFLERACWDVEVTKLGDAFHYFVYTMTKR